MRCTGVYGVSEPVIGVYGASDTGIGIYAANNATTKAAIVAEGDPGTAIHGHANAGPVPGLAGVDGHLGVRDGCRRGDRRGLRERPGPSRDQLGRPRNSGPRAARWRHRRIAGRAIGRRRLQRRRQRAGRAGKTGVYGEATRTRRRGA